MTTLCGNDVAVDAEPQAAAVMATSTAAVAAAKPRRQAVGNHLLVGNVIGTPHPCSALVELLEPLASVSVPAGPKCHIYYPVS